MADSGETSKQASPVIWPEELPNGPFAINYNTVTNNGTEKKEVVNCQGSIDLLKLLRRELDIKKKDEKDDIKESLHMLPGTVAMTPELLKSYLFNMNEIVHRHDVSISQNHKKSIVNRDLSNTVWSNIVAASHSTEGSIGVTFIECSLLPEKGADKYTIFRERIVAKPCGVSEFYNQVFVNHLAPHCGINVPQVRAIGKVTDKDLDERKSLEENFRKLYITPFHDGLYDASGSPKSLFQSPLIMLMDQAKGRPLEHRVNKQRALTNKDFKAIGKVFLFDLLIRNTDRLPSRKTLSRATGNSGNIMLNESGELWAIDNEIKLSHIKGTDHDAYVESFRSVVVEILERTHEQVVLKQLNDLIFERVPALAGVLSTSLAKIWKLTSNQDIEYQQSKHHNLAIDTLLQLIYLRATSSPLVNGKHPPPKDFDPTHSKKVVWTHWIRDTIPRAVADVLDFVEDKTGFPIEKGSGEAFIKGFVEAVNNVARNKEVIKISLHEADAELEEQSDERASFVNEAERHTIIDEHQSNREFILELIDVLVEELEQSKRRKRVWAALLKFAVKTNEDAARESAAK